MILYLDTETTSLRLGEICQLSYVLQENGNVCAKNFFFTVDDMDFGAQMVHGFSIEKLKCLSNGKRFCDSAYEILNDLSRADVIVTHNVEFDFMFLRAEFARINIAFCYKDSFCTMKEFTPFCKLPRRSGVGYKYPKLSELCAFFGVGDSAIANASQSLFGGLTGYHDARFDTTAVFLCVNAAIERGMVIKGLENYL